MGCETVGRRLADGSELCSVETSEGVDIVDNEGSVVIGPHIGESYLLTGPYRGERTDGEGVLISGPLAGHDVGPCIQLGGHHFVEVTAIDATGRPLPLSSAEISRLESSFPTSGAVILNEESLAPGQVCVDTAQQGRTLSAFRRFTDGTSYTPACLALFDESRSEETRRTLCAGLVESLYTGLPQDLRLTLSVPSLSATSPDSSESWEPFPFARELGGLFAAVAGFHYGGNILKWFDGRAISIARSAYAGLTRFLGLGGGSAAETSGTAVASESTSSSLGSRLLTGVVEVGTVLGAIGTFLTTPLAVVVPDCNLDEFRAGSCGGGNPEVM